MLVLHADDLGLTRAFNQGVMEAYYGGYLTSTSLRTNGSAFDDAIERVLPNCPDLGVGIHLNIVEGRTQRPPSGRSSRISDRHDNYTASFPKLLLAQLYGDRVTFKEVEEDLRAQIETVLSKGVTPDHLSTHQHSHGIPAIFQILCKLAVEYGIPFVRLPVERFYFGQRFGYHVGVWYPVNLAKHLVLYLMSRRNRSIATKVGIRTNDRFVGVLYTGFMDRTTVKRGLRALSSLKEGTVEVLLHPCRVTPGGRDRYIADYLHRYESHPAREAELFALTDPDLLRFIGRNRWELTSYSQLAGIKSRINPNATPTAELKI